MQVRIWEADTSRYVMDSLTVVQFGKFTGWTKDTCANENTTCDWRGGVSI